MKVSSIIGWGVLAIAALSAVSVVLSMNNIPRLDEGVNQKWANVESTYQSRNDKIPQLVAIVDGSSNREMQAVVDTIKARSEGLKSQVNISTSDPKAMQEYMASQNALTTALTNMKVVSERYPTFQSVKQFASLMVEVSGMENRLRVARNDFNAACANKNIYIRTFPGVVGNMFVNSERCVPFKAEEGAKVAPKIDFTKKPQ